MDPQLMNDNSRDGKRGSRGPSQDPQQNSAHDPMPKRVTFDDFQIQRSLQQKQVEEEKRAWAERLQREEEHKSGFLKFATPRLRKLSDDMIGGRNKFTSFLFGGKPASIEPSEEVHPEADVTAQPYFAEHEKLIVRVNKKQEDQSPSTLTFRNPDASGKKRTVELNDLPAADFHRQAHFVSDDLVASIDEELISQFNEQTGDDVEEEEEPLEVQGSSDLQPNAVDSYDDEDSEEEQEEEADEEDEYDELEEEAAEIEASAQLEEEEEYEVDGDGEFFEDGGHHLASDQNADEDDIAPVAVAPSVQTYVAQDVDSPASTQIAYASPFKDEPTIDPALKSYLDVLSGFDSFPRRASEPRDPRADFVTLLAEQLDILREQVGAMSALFFWVNNR
ncbi:MAG TPA: hypothetical protein VFH43_12095, partial [Candidatus Kapabacteria bacterium]|nr:hypothetical protein [Candidatus Kapabacteria bacterium]